MAKKNWELDGRTAIALIWKMRPSVVDEDELRRLFSGLAAVSLSDVAQVFGVSAATVRNTWRRDGMPVIESRRGVGCKVSLVEVLIWLLKRELKNEAARRIDEDTKRKRFAEADSAEIDRDLRRIRLEREEGEFVSVAITRSEFGSALSLVRDDVMSWPEQVLPLLPPKQAAEIVENLETHLGKSLNALADRCERLIEDQLERTEEDV